MTDLSPELGGLVPPIDDDLASCRAWLRLIGRIARHDHNGGGPRLSVGHLHLLLGGNWIRRSIIRQVIVRFLEVGRAGLAVRKPSLVSSNAENGRTVELQIARRGVKDVERPRTLTDHVRFDPQGDGHSSGLSLVGGNDNEAVLLR
jgi:hypothetical protein